MYAPSHKDNAITDDPFFGLAAVGVTQAQSAGHAFEYEYVGNCTAGLPAADCLVVVKWLLSRGFNHLIMISFEFEAMAPIVGDTSNWDSALPPTLQASDVRFSIIDVLLSNAPSNMMSVVFSEQQGAFVAGALAGLVSTTKRIAAVGGVGVPPVRRFVNGWRLGVKHTCPECFVQGRYMNAFWGDGARQAALFMQRTAGTDILMVAAGGAADAAERHVLQQPPVDAAGQPQLRHVVGVDVDRAVTAFPTHPNRSRVLTSILKGVDAAVAHVIAGDVTGSGFRGGGASFIDLSNGMGLAPCHASCDAWAPHVSRIADIVSAVADGTLEVGVSSTGAVRRAPIADNGWGTLRSLSLPPSPRKGAAGALLSTWFDSSTYIFGGSKADGLTSEAWAFDHTDTAWRRVAPGNLLRGALPSARAGSVAAALPGGMSCVIFGGYSSSDGIRRTALNDLHLFTKGNAFFAEQDSCSMLPTVASTPVARYDHAATPLPPASGQSSPSHHHVLVYGGRSAQTMLTDTWLLALDASAPGNGLHTWTAVATAATATGAPAGSVGCALAVHGSWAFLTGGQTLQAQGLNALDEAWRLSLTCLLPPTAAATASSSSGCAWEALPSLPSPRAYHALLPLLIDGSAVLMLTGGTDGDSQHSGTHLLLNVSSSLHPPPPSSSSSSTPLPPPWAAHPSVSAPPPRSVAVAVVAPESPDRVVLLTGADGVSGRLSSVVEYRAALRNVCAEAGLVGCSGHGVSSALTGAATCACDVGYTGTDCRECDATPSSPSQSPSQSPYELRGDGSCAIRTPWSIAVDARTEATLFLSLAALGALLCLALLLWVYLNRAQPPVRLAQPRFLALILCGALLGYATLALFAVEESTGCDAWLWTGGLSFVLVFGTLFGKTARIHALFVNRGMRRKTVTHVYVLKFVGAVTVAEVVLLLLLAFAAPRHLRSAHVFAFSVARVCVADPSATSADTVVAIFMLLNVGLLLYGAYLGFGVRNVPSAFNETKLIISAVYSWLFCGAIVLPVTYLVADNPYALFMVKSLGLGLVTTLFVLTLFAPKIHAVITKKETSYTATTHMTTGGGGNGTISGVTASGAALRAALTSDNPSAVRSAIGSTQALLRGLQARLAELEQQQGNGGGGSRATGSAAAVRPSGGGAKAAWAEPVAEE